MIINISLICRNIILNMCTVQHMHVYGEVIKQCYETQSGRPIKIVVGILYTYLPLFK